MNYSAFHWAEKARKYAETIGTIFNVKGRVNTVADLPISGNKVGDLYLVGLSTDADLTEYAWLSFDGTTRWERLGYTSITNSFSALTGSPYDNTSLATALNGKQATISDLAAIRSGASAGATALQPSALNGYATESWVNNKGYITGITSAMVTTALGYSPVNPTALATVATSGSYNDLSNKPTIPTVNNPTIKITQGGVTKGSFTLNQSTGETIEIDASGGTVDQTYDSTSTNAQSGTAVAGAISGKVDLNLNNMNPSATAKETIVGWGLPDYTAGVSLTTTKTEATSNGFILLHAWDNGSINIYLYSSMDSSDNIPESGVRIGCQSGSSSQNSVFIPVKKGMAYSIGDRNGGNVKSYFYPCIGG